MEDDWEIMEDDHKKNKMEDNLQRKMEDDLKKST